MADVSTSSAAYDAQSRTTPSPTDFSLETTNDDTSWKNIEYADIKLLQASPLLNENVSFDVGPGFRTSTPGPPLPSGRKYHSVQLVNGVDPRNSSFASSVVCVGAEEMTVDARRQIDAFEQVQVPIVGYETVEERAKFTVNWKLVYLCLCMYVCMYVCMCGCMCVCV